MITVELEGDAAVIAKFEAIPARLQASLVRRVTGLAIQTEALVKQKLSGQVLKVRTGNLRDSIHSDVAADTDSVTGRVFSDKSVRYARIHEYGGVTSAHVIEPKDPSGVLAFKVNGSTVFARRVNHPGSKIPARPFMRPSLAEMKPKIIASFKAAAAEALQ